jgi:photosystem II reaction center protein Psb28
VLLVARGRVRVLRGAVAAGGAACVRAGWLQTRARCAAGHARAGLFMIDDEGTLTTTDVKARFVNGKPTAIEARYSMRSQFEWDRFIRFMDRCGARAAAAGALSCTCQGVAVAVRVSRPRAACVIKTWACWHAVMRRHPLVLRCVVVCCGVHRYAEANGLGFEKSSSGAAA